jgi:trans-2,3-dihydro-3-hydroxyanthranilate isomerase
VREDPASGNAAAFLGHYLLEHRLAADAFDIRIEQGHFVGRPSLVRVRARGGGDARHVAVGGQVVPVVRGELTGEY